MNRQSFSLMANETVDQPDWVVVLSDSPSRFVIRNFVGKAQVHAKTGLDESSLIPIRERVRL
ncbi:MAG: hypothetical protein ACK6DQ_13990, partial [Planctomycetota bacterium]